MAAGDRSLEHTPTWALATVCFVFISTSVFIDHIIHLLANWLKGQKKSALRGAVEKLKSELMLLGFMSLLLAVIQDLITTICIPSHIADTMLPCRKQAKIEHFVVNFPEIIRRLDENYDSVSDDEVVRDSCRSKGKVAVVTSEAIHQLHIFMFVLAVMQIVYSTVTMALGRAKMKRWKAWEKETQTTEYLVANDPNRFRFTRQTTFGRRHMNNFSQTPILLWIKCFFRQFFNSVAKVDYLTLRHGFITAHLSTSHHNFNFQQYTERALEEDFSSVVGISPLMWLGVVILLLVDVYGWLIYSWLSYVPMLIVLILGTKLEVIVAKMALQIKDHNNVVIGTPLVKPNDKLFWFGKPKFMLTLLHYTLFMNAFELSFFIWVTIQFGVNSCYNVHTAGLITRVVLGVTVQVLCSYITLPLYALVTQMGSEIKRKLLVEKMREIFKRWLADVRKRRRKLDQCVQSPRISLSLEWSPRLCSVTSSVEALTSMRSKSYRGDIVE